MTFLDPDELAKCTCHYYATDDNGGFDVDLDPDCPLIPQHEGAPDDLNDLPLLTSDGKVF